MLTLKHIHKTVLNKVIWYISIAITLLVPLFLSGNSYAYGGKVSTLGTTPVNEGSSEVVTFTLNAPIICSSGPCEVDLNLTSSDPTNVSFSPNPVVWTMSQWSQPMTATINTVDNGIYNNGETVTITATVVSNATYYSGYTLNFPLTINNIDPPPAPSLSNQTVSLATNTTSSTDVIDGVSGSPDPSTLTIVSRPAHGSAAIASSNITYTPNTNYSGPDSLVYSVCSLLNSSVCSTATISFAVSAHSGTTANASHTLTPDTGYGVPTQNISLHEAFILSSMLLSLEFVSLGLKILAKPKS
jgi:hypothetical protein